MPSLSIYMYEFELRAMALPSLNSFSTVPFVIWFTRSSPFAFRNTWVILVCGPLLLLVVIVARSAMAIPSSNSPIIAYMNSVSRLPSLSTKAHLLFTVLPPTVVSERNTLAVVPSKSDTSSYCMATTMSPFSSMKPHLPPSFTAARPW